MRKFLFPTALLLALAGPVAAADNQVEQVTKTCVLYVHFSERGTPQFDAYYDPLQPGWRTYGTDYDTYEFSKCMAQYGYSLELPSRTRRR